MVTNFEKLTQPLSKEEKAIAMFIGRYIRKNSRKDKESSNRFIQTVLHVNNFAVPKGVRIRAMIHWLRVKNKFKWILANSKGYYYSRDSSELERYIKSLTNRVNSINEVK